MASINESADVKVNINGQEAVDELKRIRQETEKVNKALAETNDKEEIQKLRKQLKTLEGDMRKVRSSAQSIDAAMQHLDTKHAKELKQLVRDIKGQLESGFIKRGTQEWDDYVKKLKLAKEELKHIYDEQVFITRLEPPKNFFEKITQGATKIWSAFDMGVRIVEAVYDKISKYIDALSAKQESSANLKALTGLDDQSIQWLTEQAERLSTQMDETGLRVTQSSREILEAYMLVGSAKPELLKDAEALNAVTVEAMRLAAAAKMDLKGAVDAVTLSLNQYGQDASQAARFTNVLAAGSKAGAAGVVEQTAAIVKSGVAVAGANVSFEQHVGLIETLAEKGIKAEVAGTALKAIFLKLASGANDTNPAIVGLDTALENLAAKNLSVTQLTKMFGESAVSAAKILIDNAGKVREYTAAVTGTAVATEQAAINSDTYAARAAQARNAMAELGMKLAAEVLPAIEAFNEGLTGAAPALAAIIPAVARFAPAIIALVAAVKLYSAAAAVATTAQKAWNLVMAASPWTWVATGIAAVVAALAYVIPKLTGAADSMKQLTREMRLQQAMQRDLASAEEEANKSIASQAARLKTLTAVIHDNRRSLEDRRRAISEIQKIVPKYHGSITAEGKLINDNTAALKDYIHQLKEAAMQQAIQAKMTKLAEAEINKDMSRSRRQNAVRVRKDRLSEFDADHGDIAGLSKESLHNGLAHDRIKAYAAKNNLSYSRAQTEMAQLLAQRNKLVDSIKEAEGWVSEADDDIANLQARQQQLINHGAKLVKSLPADTADASGTASPAPPAVEKPKKTKSSDALRQQLADLDKSAELLRNIAAIEQAHGALTEQQYAAEILRINIALYTKKRDLYQKDSAEWTAWEAKRVQEGKKAEDAQTKAITDAAAQRLQQEQAARQQAEQLRRQYDPAAAREEDMQRELALAKTLHAQGLLEEENYQRILQGIRQKYVAAEAKSKPEKAESPFRVAQADDTFGISGAFTQMLQTIEAKRMAEEEIARLEEQGNITHEQAMQRRQAIDDNTWQHYASVAQAAIGMVSNIMNAASQLMQANQDLELAKLNQRYDAEIAAAGNNEEKKKELEAKRQQEQAAIKKKYNQRAMKMEIAQAVAQTAMAAISAYASAAAVPVVGYVMAPIAAAMALAAGAIQIATIKKQHAAEEAGYYSGGYTGGHRYRREAGVVHEGEFVANHEAVRNPAVRPMLDLIDQAQRNNTIGSITPEDVSRRLTAPHRAAQLSDAITTASGGDTGESPFTVRQDPRHTAALNRLADQLQHPIHAVVTIDGPDGVKYNLDRFNQLQARK